MYLMGPRALVPAVATLCPAQGVRPEQRDRVVKGQTHLGDEHALNLGLVALGAGQPRAGGILGGHSTLGVVGATVPKPHSVIAVGRELDRGFGGKHPEVRSGDELAVRGPEVREQRDSVLEPVVVGVGKVHAAVHPEPVVGVLIEPGRVVEGDCARL